MCRLSISARLMTVTELVASAMDCGKREAVTRKDFMLLYLQQLGREIGVVGPQSCLLDA